MAILLTSVVALHAQDPVTLQFTGQNQHGLYVPLSSVNVENLTKRWQEVLYYPDTTLNIGVTGVEEFGQDGDGVRLFQNVPNPFDGVTDFALQLPEASDVLLEIYDLNGKVEATYKGSLDPGTHQFRAWLESPQTYLLNARTENGAVRIKMVNTSRAGQSRIEYIGKGASLRVENPKNDSKGDITMPFNYGDTMSYLGFAHLANQYFTSSPIVQAQHNSTLIPLTFTLPLPTVITEAATNITTTEVQLNGSVVEHPEYPVTERGFLFADNESLTEAVEYVAGLGSGQFHHTITNLELTTRYYYRAYAQTAMGTTYGDVLYFNTHAELPEIHTLEVTNITNTSATCGGNVTGTGGTDVIAQGVCWSTSPNPTVSDNHTNDPGMDIFTSHITGLTPSTTYYVRAYATNSAGTAYGEQRTFTTLSAFFCGIDVVTDYDGNVYNTVEIGQQCWMKENLCTTHFADGTEIPIGSISSNNIAYRYYPNHNSSIVPIYGYLYNWAAVMHGATSSNANPSGVQGICPPGWHVPSKAEFDQLTNFVSSQSQYVCGNNNIAKALASTVDWPWYNYFNSPCAPGYFSQTNNATGFSAKPAGLLYENLSSVNFTSDCYIWSSNLHTVSSGLCVSILNVGNIFPPSTNAFQERALSVRCLLDDSGVNGSNAILPTVTTKAISYVSSSSARCGGHVYGSGGAEVTARGICWDTLPNPTVNDSYTSDGNGTCGFSSNMTGLMPSTTYYVRAYATNSVGTAYGEQQSFTTWDSLICNSTLKDYDSNIYHTVAIGQQCWMKENLRTTHFPNGTAIPFQTTNLNGPNRVFPNNDSSLVSTYGYLYNWYAVMNGESSSNANPSGVQGICPTGWHLPSKAEWEQLLSFLSSRIEYCCGGDTNFIARSLAANSGWEQSNWPCAPGFDANTNNATGFSALPAGYCDNTGINEATHIWSSSLWVQDSYYCLYLNSQYQWIYITAESQTCGASVRCLRD